MHLVRHVSPQEYWAKIKQFRQATEFLDLTPADRHMAWAEITSDEHFHEWPVPMLQFCTDPYYIGQDVKLRPVIGEFLADFWEPANGFEVFVFIGGIGAGKSFSASLSLAYGIYGLSCLKKPAEYLLGFPGVSLSLDAPIVFMNASAAGAVQAGKIVYGEAYERIQKSPYFHQHFEPYQGKSSELEFPHRIRLSPGSSQARTAIGWNVYGFVVDEAAFGTGGDDTGRVDQVKALFSELDMRRRSRFGGLGFGGLFTSPGSEHAFVEVMAGERGGVHTMVRRTTTWEAQDQLKPLADIKPGEKPTKVFLLDRHPDVVRILERDLIYVAPGICQTEDGTEVRYESTEPPEIEQAA